ncbi:MAG TPA: cadherin-like domain-containing protein, partial [Agitococcus sp.]|nr:cadherin-like domain-containing protein [Agitococcus sp.]
QGGVIAASNSFDVQPMNDVPIFTMRLSKEFLVNKNTEFDQKQPAITTLTDGSFVIVWTSSFNNESSESGIYAQHYMADGQYFGEEFLVNHTIMGEKSSPSISVLGEGFVVTWDSYEQDGSNLGVYAQRYDKNRNKLGEEFRVNTVTHSEQAASAITELKNGDFVVTWMSMQNGMFRDIYAKRYASNGDVLGDEFRVNQSSVDEQAPKITHLANGGFVVTWMSYNQDGSRWGVYARCYDSLGVPLTNEILINQVTQKDQQEPSIAMLPNGGFVVVWMSEEQDGSGWGVYSQSFDDNGMKIGSEIQVNTNLVGDQFLPVISPLTDGGFVIVWQSGGQDGSGWGIYGQRFDSKGFKVNREFLINTATSGDQHAPVVTGLQNGGFVVVWQSENQDGSGTGIYAKEFYFNQAVLAHGSEDTAYILSANDLLEGFSDVDGDILRVVNLTATNGALSDNQNGTYTFTPNTNFNGVVNITYQVSDGHNGIVDVVNSFEVRAVNDNPTGNASATLLNTTKGIITYNVLVSDLLQGFSDVEGDTLMVANLTADHATVINNN